MLIPRTTFFLALLALVLVTAVTPKLCWLSHTRRTTGIMAFEGKGNAGEQMPLSYSVISFRVGKDTIWFNGVGNLRFRSGDSIPVRYRADNISDAKVDIFAGMHSTWRRSGIY